MNAPIPKSGQAPQSPNPEAALGQGRPTERRAGLARTETSQSRAETDASFHTANDSFNNASDETGSESSLAVPDPLHIIAPKPGQSPAGVQLNRAASTDGETLRALSPRPFFSPSSTPEHSRPATPDNTVAGSQVGTIPRPHSPPTTPPPQTTSPLPAYAPRDPNAPTGAPAPTPRSVGPKPQPGAPPTSALTPPKRSFGQKLKMGAKVIETILLSPWYAYHLAKAIPAIILKEHVNPSRNIVALQALTRIVQKSFAVLKPIVIGLVQIGVAVAPLVLFCTLASLPGGIFAFGLVLMLVPFVGMLTYKTRQIKSYFLTRQAAQEDADS